jgi:hypothetical protein
MNRFFRAAMVAAIFPLGLASVGCMHKSGSTANCGNGGGCGNGSGDASGGCGARYRNWVDVAWPERYNYAARQAVVAPFAQQVATGHFINQSLWNWYFEPGSDKLTPGGMEKLDSLARATPSSDPRLYIQTAHDIAVTNDNMDKVAALRNDLNARRAASIKKYMATQFGPAIEYEVFVHDAPVPGIYGPFVAGAFRGQAAGYQGGIDAGGGGGAPAVGGSRGGVGAGTGGGGVGSGSMSGPAPTTGGPN